MDTQEPPAAQQPVRLRVRGEWRERREPERARARFSVEVSAVGSLPPVRQVNEAVTRLRARLGAGGQAPRGVAGHQVGQLRTWSMTDEQGIARSMAQVEMSVDFTDFVMMGTLLTELGSRGDVSLGWIEWLLEDSTRRELERSARRVALESALLRARDYADALGLDTVEVCAVSDSGLGDVAPRMTAMVLAGEALAPDAGIFAPDEVEVAAEIEVELTAH